MVSTLSYNDLKKKTTKKGFIVNTFAAFLQIYYNTSLKRLNSVQSYCPTVFVKSVQT